MTVYKLKFNENKLNAVLTVLCSFCITVVLSWKETDGFFTDFFYMVVNPEDTPGITGEEKERIINEQLKNVIHSKIEL